MRTLYFTASLTEGSPVAGSAAGRRRRLFSLQQGILHYQLLQMQLREASPRGWRELINGKRGQLAQLLLQRNSAVKRLRDGKYCGFQFAHRQVLPLLLVEGIELVGEPLQLLHALRPAGKVFRGQCASTQLLPPLLRQRLRLIRPADQGLVDQLVAVADRPVRRQAGKLAKLALRLWQINRPRGVVAGRPGIGPAFWVTEMGGKSD